MGDVLRGGLQWRYQARPSDCRGCPLRKECTTRKGPRMLCVNVYREDLQLHAARMKADPERTRDLLGRHRAMSEGVASCSSMRFNTACVSEGLMP